MLDSGSDWHEVGLTGFLLDLGGGEGGGAIRPEGRQPIGGRRGDSLFFSSYKSFYLFVFFFIFFFALPTFAFALVAFFFVVQVKENLFYLCMSVPFSFCFFLFYSFLLRRRRRSVERVPSPTHRHRPIDLDSENGIYFHKNYRLLSHCFFLFFYRVTENSIILTNPLKLGKTRENPVKLGKTLQNQIKPSKTQ